MIRRVLARLFLLLAAPAFAAAPQHVTVGTTQQPSNGALFLADSRGYFKAEGLDVEMKSYASPVAVVQALAGGAIDFGLTDFSAQAFNLAGTGAIKAVAAQAREKRGIEGNDIIVAVGAYNAGVRTPADLRGRSIAITTIGSTSHYQLAEIARAERFDLAGIKIRPLQTYDAVARAIADGRADAAILPAQYARELTMAGLGRVMTWCSEFGEQQLGALFVAAKMIDTRHAAAAKFIHAYRRGAADYADALARYDRFSKPISDSKSRTAAATIARYVYPGLPLKGAAAAVELGAFHVDPQARLDVADLERQLSWFKSQRLVGGSVNSQNVVDMSFIEDR